jgi:hypothetical protein
MFRRNVSSLPTDCTMFINFDVRTSNPTSSQYFVSKYVNIKRTLRAKRLLKSLLSMQRAYN